MKAKRNENSGWRRLVSLLVTALAPLSALACGPFFPNSMLDRGDEAVLAAPKANFFVDLERIRLPRSNFRAVNVTDYAAEADEADRVELAAALKARKFPAKKSESLLREFALERARLTALRVKVDQWRFSRGDDVGSATNREPRPTLAEFDASALSDAPEEFIQYLKGSVAWFNGQTNQARELWQELLHHPAGERHYRSTWAAYMLGKSWAEEDPEKAKAYFQQVRALRTAGFADRIGLASASLGEEARVWLRQTNPGPAIDLYLQQLETGDNSAESSLRFVCRDAMTNSTESLARLAANPSERRVLTSYVIANHLPFDDDEGNFDADRLRWLTAVESANVGDVECAEELALAAYQAGQWDVAQRWLNRSSDTPTTQWLQAKLFLRAGKIKEAAALLDRVIKALPERYNETNSDTPAGLEDTLRVNGTTYTTDFVSMRSQALAEAGVLHLTRREYTESLDALLRAGFWLDAAYVAERVLTAGELKNYVDENWPAPTPDVKTNSSDAARCVDAGKDIRYLLGRRLARAGEWEVARAYYPTEQLTNYNAMANYLQAAISPNVAPDNKIDALLAAASVLRLNGMELVGYEAEPDWAIFPAFEFDVTAQNRATERGKIAPASAEEIERAEQGLDSRRYHYRYNAAGLAMEAAKLMPDNTDEKAIVLCTAGSWLKARDPKTADIYYKALVRHCRKTAIGTLADRMRWFPELDASGNPIPWKPEPPIETNAPTGEAANGYWFALNRGNDLQDVAAAALREHQLELTAEEIQQANAEINTNRLKAGLRIFVPALSRTAKEETQ